MKKSFFVGICMTMALLLTADEKRQFVEWNFNDKNNPLKSSGTEGLEMKCLRKNNSEFAPGIEGQALKFSGKEKLCFYELPKSVAEIFTDGNRSFTAECYIKTPDIEYSLLGGNRCVATWYNLSGWSFGILRTGNITASIGNGKQRSYTWWNHLESPWIPEEWNHIAMVRDAEKNMLILYVNGKRSPNPTKFFEGTTQKEKPFAIATDSEINIRIGYDSMSGSTMRGLIDNFRITKGIVPESELRARAEKLNQIAKGKNTGKKNESVNVYLPEYVASIPLSIQPPPRKFKASSKETTLPESFIMAYSGDSAEKTAAEEAQIYLKKFLNINKISIGNVSSSSGTLVSFEKSSMKNPEGYSINGKLINEKLYRITVKAEKAAFLYAIDTLQQIIRISTLRNNGKISLPESFDLSDHPAIPLRISVCGMDRALSDAPDFDLFMQYSKFRRLNGILLSTQKTPEKRLRIFCRSAEKYDMNVISWFSYLETNPPYSPLDKKSMAEFKEFIDKNGRTGVSGILYAFDDLVDSHTSELLRRPSEKAAFETPAKLQNALIMQGEEFAKPYKFKYKMAMPFLYSKGWEPMHNKEGTGYFREFSKSFKEHNIVMLHTTFTEREIADLKKAGAETYGYYLNGLWPTHLFFKWYTGMERLAWTWNMFYIDRNGKGPQPYPDKIAEIKKIHKRTPVLCGASSSHIGLFLTGIVAWNPEKYDKDKAGRSVAQRYYGSGVYEPLKYFEEAIMPVLTCFRSYKTSWTNESKAPETERKALLSAKELLAYRRNYLEAEKAYGMVKEAIESQKSFFDRPYLYDWRKNLLKDMRVTLDKTKQKLTQLMENKGIRVE